MKSNLSNLLNIFGTEWFLIIIALFYVDSSTAMLYVIFVAPIIVTVFFVINLLINKIKDKKNISKIVLALRIISILLAITAYVLIIEKGSKFHDPEEKFKALIMDPVPESVVNLDSKGSLRAMGSSSFVMTFDINPNDLNTILDSQRFSNFKKNDIDNITGRKPKLYKESLEEAKIIIGDVSEIYIHEHSNSGYRYDILIVNKDHNKVYYGAV